MNLFVSVAMITLLACDHASKARPSSQVNLHTEPQPDYALRVVGIESDQFLMGPDGPMASWFKVKKGDILSMTIQLENKKKARKVMIRLRQSTSPPSDSPEFGHSDGLPAISGGCEILSISGLDQELAIWEQRAVTVKLKVNSDQEQLWFLDFFSPDDPPEDRLSKATQRFGLNNPKVLAEHESALGRAKNQ